MSEAVAPESTRVSSPPTLGGVCSERKPIVLGLLVLLGVLIYLAFQRSFFDIYHNWQLPESLYSHAMLIPPISLFFVWRLRKEMAVTPVIPSRLGYLVLGSGCLMLLLGDFLGFMTFVHLALLPVLTGISLIFLGRAQTAIIWFPLAFLFFMIPMPYSVTSGIAFQSKMLATESAVSMGKLLTMHVVQDGSYVYLGADDRLLVGDVCGGMRSLVALLAFGALMAYVSKTRWWAKILILCVSPAIAILANVIRIFFLCVVGYFWGSETATGTVHDVSGIGIFAVAFVLLFTAEAFLRKIAPGDGAEGPQS